MEKLSGLHCGSSPRAPGAGSLVRSMHSRHLIALQLSSWGMTLQDRIASSAIGIWKASMSGPEPGATSSGGQVCIHEGCSRRRFLREKSRPGHVDNYHFSHSISIAGY